MPNITKHDSEKEGESDDGEETRIDFLIGGDTIGIDDALETLSELVGTMEGWGSLRCRNLLEDWRDRRSGSFLLGEQFSCQYASRTADSEAQRRV